MEISGQLFGKLSIVITKIYFRGEKWLTPLQWQTPYQKFLSCTYIFSQFIYSVMIAKQIGFKSRKYYRPPKCALHLASFENLCERYIVIHFTYSRTKNKNERILYAYYLKINILMFLLLNWVSVLNSISVIFNQSL